MKNYEIKTTTDESTSVSGASGASDKFNKIKDKPVHHESREENFESTIDEDLPESPPHTKNINAFGRFRSHLASIHYNQTPKSINF